MTAAKILLPALEDLIERSGYYGTTYALDDLRATVHQLDSGAPAGHAANRRVPLLAWFRQRGPQRLRSKMTPTPDRRLGTPVTER